MIVVVEACGIGFENYFFDFQQLKSVPAQSELINDSIKWKNLIPVSGFHFTGPDYQLTYVFLLCTKSFTVKEK